MLNFVDLEKSDSRKEKNVWLNCPVSSQDKLIIFPLSLYQNASQPPCLIYEAHQQVLKIGQTIHGE